MSQSTVHEGRLEADRKLRTWGEAGVAKTKVLATPKVGDRGVTCMFVGYNTDHGDDVYRMWNPDTKRLLRSRDVRWLGRYYFDKPKSNPSAKVRENVSVTSREIDMDDTDDEKSDDEIEMSDSSADDDASEAEDKTEAGGEDAWKDAPHWRRIPEYQGASCNEVQGSHEHSGQN